MLTTGTHSQSKFKNVRIEKQGDESLPSDTPNNDIRFIFLVSDTHASMNNPLNNPEYI
jgi:hypothetical protein